MLSSDKQLFCILFSCFWVCIIVSVTYAPCWPECERCQCCQNGNCVDGCCGGPCCDDKRCYNPETKKCCGRGDGSICPKDKNCCDDGSCAMPCEIVEGQKCEPPFGSTIMPCASTCALVDGPCGFPLTKVWSGKTETTCSPEGCDGDCSKDTHWCSKTYDCVPSGNFETLSNCSTISSSYPPITYSFQRCVTGFGQCQSCMEGPEPENPPEIQYDSCNN